MEPDKKDLPESYTVGQEYFKGSKLVPIRFELVFRTSAEIQDAKIAMETGESEVTYCGDHVVVRLLADVPEKLFSAWHSGDSNASQWILGYVEKVMLPFNQELQKQRHHFGNPFIRNYSVFDIQQLRIVDEINSLGVKTLPPGSVENFPFFETPPSELSERVYIKDFLDAYYAYFSYNFDECLRKVVTSLECFFKYHKLETPPAKQFPFNLFRRIFRKMKFISLVKTHITTRCELAEKNIGEELIKAYKIRNSIVHDGKRYEAVELKKIAFDALHFLMDAYKFYEHDRQLNQFVTGIEHQFLAHSNLVGQGLTMDFLIKNFDD